MERETTLLTDRAVQFATAKTYVFSDSVLCLGGISDEPVEAWESRITRFLETRYLKDLDRIDGEPMDFEWKVFPGITTLGIRSWPTLAKPTSARVSVLRVWPSLAKTEFGQNRVWPKPTLAKPSLAKPILANPMWNRFASPPTPTCPPPAPNPDLLTNVRARPVLRVVLYCGCGCWAKNGLAQTGRCHRFHQEK